MRRPRAWLAIPALLAAGAPPARAAPTRHLTGQLVDGRNLHIANQGGAIHWQADVRFAVDLHADQQLEARVTGSRGEHNLYADHGARSYSTDDETAWTTRWGGRWALSHGALRLDLVRVDDTCTHQRTASDAAPETLPCKAASARARLRCVATALALPAPDGGRAHQVAGWSCTLEAGGDLGEAAGPWLLGEDTCVQRSVMGGISACAP
jgi:hypothetical protein